MDDGDGWTSESTRAILRVVAAEASSTCASVIWPSLSSRVEDHVVVVDEDRKRLGDELYLPVLRLLRERGTRLDRDGVGARGRISGRPGLARARVVLPRVPRADDERGRVDDLDRARLGRRDPRHDEAFAERPALVRAAVADGVEVVAEAEDADLAAADAQNPPRPRLELGDGAYD